MSYTYIYDGKEYSDTSTEFMTSLGIDEDTQESILRQETYETDCEWERLREKRDELLVATDFTQLTDNALTADQKKAWKAYRKALRDLPEATTNPFAAEWPVKPE